MEEKMSPKEYDETIKEIKERARTETQKLYSEYALSNNPYKLGDIVKDHKCIIKIDKIGVHVGFNKYPKCIYYGQRLKKDLTEFKSGERESVFQCNIEE